MKTYISLLRGINVGRQNRISMAELKRLCESLGLRDVVTYIQSGNVVFDCAEKDPVKIIKIIEAGINRSLGSDVRVIVREKNSLKKVLESNPFVIQRKADPEKLYITFLADTPSELVLTYLTSPPPDPRPRAGENKVSGSWQSGKPSTNSPNPSDEKPSPLPPKYYQSRDNFGDEFIICDREIYLFCPHGYGKTKFSNTFFEKRLSILATTRNWKTVNALYEIAERR
jgi:uncharacterized protein (DUF1697 family)